MEAPISTHTGTSARLASAGRTTAVVLTRSSMHRYELHDLQVAGDTRIQDFVLFGLPFADIAEGTVYALLIRVEQRGLVDVEKVPSEKGPPRKVYALNGDGRDYLDEFWRTWSFLAGRLDQLRDGEDR